MDMAKCEHCSPAVALDPKKVIKVLEHIGAHILFNNNLILSLEPCGLCLRPSPSCVFYLRKGKGAGSSCQVDLRCSRCPRLQRFSYQSASIEAPNSPCTNVPIVCPLCPSTASAVWKYNMRAHFSKHHPTASFGDHFPDMHISNSERDALQQKWRSRYKTRKSKATKKSEVPLAFSDEHSSRQAFL